MKIFLTGSTGFIGQHLANHYRSLGHEVYCYLRGQDVKWTLDRVKPDIILHPAAEIYKPELMFDSNVRLTAELVEWVQYNTIPMINFGSTSEYGWCHAETSENTVLQPHTAYAGSKAAATMLCQGWATEFELDIVTLRLYSVYGAGEKPHRMFARLWQSFMLNRNIQLVNGVHDFVYIKDVVHAVDCVVNSNQRKPGEIVNVANGHQYTNLEVLTMFETVTGRTAPVDFYEEKFVTQPVWQGSSEILRNKYNWYPKYDLQSGVVDFLETAKYD